MGGMVRIFLVVFLVFLGIADAWGADRQISGVVYDGDKLNSDEGLAAATVSCVSSPVVGTTTDLTGKFSLKCSEESAILVEFVGYEDARISVDELAKNSTELNITLKSSNSIEAVEVVATKKSSNSIEAVDVVATNKVGDTCDPCADRYKVDNADCDNGKKGSLEEIDSKVVCVPADCVNGYVVDVETGKCVKKKTAPAEQAPVNTAASKNTQTQKPHSEEELEELQGKVDAAKEKEQSFANRMLSGATMAATGAGGQMLASALAEQNADADAERDMAAYLATFRCNWGSNSVQGGEQNVALAGGNELISLYQEYVALANDLKIRKSALDMTAGIESEPILDGATSGLYDDVGTGITSGAYASLARALMDPSGVDAQKWAAQKEQTQKQLKTGAITAGVGAVVGLAGNVLINHVNYNKKKRKDDPAVKAKYKEVTDKIEQLEREVNATPVSAANSGENCEKYGVTGTWPDCDCGDKNKTFSSEKKACGDTSSNSTETPAENKCNLTGKYKSDTCECVDNATRVDNNECVCKLGYEDPENKNVCTPVSKEEEKAEREAETKTVVVETHLSSDILFKTGSAELTQTAKKYIFDFTYLIEQYPHLLNKESFKKDENGNTKATIIIYGHTDRVPFKAGSNMTNEKLSEQRAEAIKRQLIKQSSLFKEIADDIHVFGKGADECTEQYHPKANDPQCRKVNIEISVSSDDAEGLGNLQAGFHGFFLGSDQATGTGARFGQK